MAIKKTEILSRADFDEAVVTLRLNVSEIAKETGIPRTYLSEFRNGDRKLRPEHQAKLRDYFEAKGVVFDDAREPEPAAAAGEDNATALHPRVQAVQGIRLHFPIADTVPAEIVNKAVEMMDDADARLATLLKTSVTRDDGLFGEAGFTEEFKAALQEAFGLLAGGYVIFRMLRGWPAFGVKPLAEQPETLRDVLFSTFNQTLIDAGLIEPEENAEVAAEGEEVTK